MSVAAHVALLRGVNVGGKNKLPMKDLVALAEEAGAKAPRTYIQSGNLVFEASAAAARAFPRRLEAALAARGLRVPVVLRSADELVAAVAGNPWLARGAEPKALHVAFLAAAPEPARLAALDPARSPPDALEARGRDLFLHLPNGVGRTKLTNDYLDRTLGTTSTVRNWNTVLALLALARGSRVDGPEP